MDDGDDSLKMRLIMKTPFLRLFLPGVLLGFAPVATADELPSDEAGIIALFQKAGARLTLNDSGHVTKLFSGGKPEHSVAELQLIGTLPYLEQIALNSPTATNADWGFLHDLPNLKQLTIWHCKTIQSLEPFSNLGIEALTVGGSMGLRNLNQEDPQKQHDAVLTLTGLPNLLRLNLYHTPQVSNDAHLAHLAKEFPKLVDLKIDLNAPRGFETAITPEGLGVLQKLPLTILSLEHANSLTPAHMEVIAGIETLEALLIDARRNTFDTAPLVETLQNLRPELEVVIAGEDAIGPPQRSRKPKA